METNKNIKNTILTQAKKVRDIQNKKLTPLEESIIKSLMKIYPHLNEENATDWMCEIINSESDKDINAIFKRIEDVFNN